MKPALNNQTEQAIDALLRRPSGSWVFSGLSETMADTALWIACALHGHATPTENCVRCHQILNSSHPDLYLIGPSDKGSIGIAEIHGVTHNLGVSRHDKDQPYRVIIVKQAEAMTPEAQNAFLKSLEEPPADAIIILITTQPAKLLETIRSRCRVIQFNPVAREGVATDSSAAQALLAKSDFERLVFAGGEVGSISELLQQLGDVLGQKLRQASTTAEIDQLSRGQMALERLQRNLQQNVSIKTALSGFFLELPCL